MKYIYTFFTILTLLLLDAEMLFAGTTYQPLAPLPINGAGGNGEIDFATYMIGIFNLAIGIAAVLAVVFIVIGGIQYMSTDAYSGKTDGKEKIQNALLGLLLAISAYTILYNINPDLAMVNFDLSGVETPENPTNDFGPNRPTQILRNVFPATTVSAHYFSGGVTVRGSGPFTFVSSEAPDGLTWVQRTDGERVEYNLIGNATSAAEGTHTITVTAINKDGVEIILPNSTLIIEEEGSFTPVVYQRIFILSILTSDPLAGEGYYIRTGVDRWIKNDVYLYGPYRGPDALSVCEADTERALEMTRREARDRHGEAYVKNVFLNDEDEPCELKN